MTETDETDPRPQAGVGTMRAAIQHRYGAPAEVFSVEEVELPAIGSDEVLVRVHAAGVNWADWSMSVGMPYIMRLGYGLRAPRNGIRGSDVAGTVVDVGSEVDRWSAGDEVLGWSTRAFAEYAAAPAHQLVAKPSTMGFEESAGLPMAGCVALQAVRDVGAVEPGDAVLVVGASGGIGSLTVQIAKAYGAEVAAVCSTPNLEFVRSLGADTVIDYTKEDFTTRSERYDMILDIADTHSLSARRKVLEDDGTLIPNSGRGGPVLGSVPRIFRAWMVSPFVSQRLRPFLSMATQEDLVELTRLVQTGAVRPIVGSTYLLEEAGRAISEAGSGHARGKVVITVHRS